MKKILLAASLLAASFSFAQESNSIDKTSRLLFDTYKKILNVTQSEKQKETNIVRLNDIKNNTNDVELKSMIDTELEKLSKIKFITTPAKSLDEIDSKFLKKFEVNNDKFNDVTFIQGKWATIYADVYPYIVLKDGNVSLRLKTIYNGQSWVFYDQIIFLLDGEKTIFEPNLTSRDISSKTGVYEYGDTPINLDNIKLINDIYNAKTIEYQFKGKSSADRKMKKLGHQIFKETIDLYNQLKK